jgi:preprotein translocase subunit SecF
VPVSAAASTPDRSETDEEPSGDAELADAAVSGRAAGIRISRVESGSRPDLRPTSEGAAKRPQPQHKPRSQRKK